MAIEDERVDAVAALLMGTMNAPESEIWRVSRLIATMNGVAFSPLELVEDGDADVLITALKAYRPENIDEENATYYYIQQLQKVAADKEEAHA